MNEIKLAWLAGLVDGEGSIGAYITRTSQKTRKSAKYESVHVVYQFTIANTNEAIIEEAHQIVSAILGDKTPATAIQVVVDKRPSRVNNRVGYCVNVKDHKGIIKVLSILEPYLVGKKSQAQVLLSLLKKHPRHTKYTKAELQVIEILKNMKRPVRDDGNAELSQESSDSCKCVEHIEAASQSEMDFEMKTCADTP